VVDTCGFCGDDRTAAWAIIAGPSIGVCDRCLRLMTDIVAEGAGRPKIPGPSDGPFSSCAFCGNRGVPLIVGSVLLGPVDPVICHACVQLAHDVLVNSGSPLDHPWFGLLRDEPWIGKAGDEDPSALVEHLVRQAPEIGTAVDARMAELQRVDAATAEAVRRREIVRRIGLWAESRGIRVPFGTAAAAAEAVG
jgi:hypothetical protein